MPEKPKNRVLEVPAVTEGIRAKKNILLTIQKYLIIIDIIFQQNGAKL